MSYNSYRCKFGSNYILWNSVTVARQTLTLFVGVRIPIPQPTTNPITKPNAHGCGIFTFTIFHQNAIEIVKMMVFYNKYDTKYDTKRMYISPCFQRN